MLCTPWWRCPTGPWAYITTRVVAPLSRPSVAGRPAPLEGGRGRPRANTRAQTSLEPASRATASTAMTMAQRETPNDHLMPERSFLPGMAAHTASSNPDNPACGGSKPTHTPGQGGEHTGTQTRTKYKTPAHKYASRKERAESSSPSISQTHSLEQELCDIRWHQDTRSHTHRHTQRRTPLHGRHSLPYHHIPRGPAGT